MPSLGHLAVGRGAFPGPIAGGYAHIGFGLIDAADTLTDSVVAGCVMPVGFRIEAVTWTVVSTTGSAVSFNLHKNASYAIDTNETDLLSAAVDLDANATGVVRPSGTTPTVVSGARGSANDNARNIDRGEYLILTVNTDATTGAIGDLAVHVWGFILDHANASPSDD